MNFGNINEVWSVRLKIFEPCNWSCEWCHNEWGIAAQAIQWSKETEDVLNILRKECTINEVHLTWGEPTLNPHLAGIMQWCKSNGFVTKLTSNGQFSPKIRDDIVGAGIDAMTVSLHSVVPEDLVRMMRKPVDTEWAKRQIETSKTNIITLNQNWVKVRINSVISWPEDVERVLEVFRFATEQGVEMRLLDDLTRKEQAWKAIEWMIKEHRAEHIRTEREPGTSSSRSLYNFPKIWPLVIKRIEKIFLREVCEQCDHFGKDSCQEGFYNVRLQKKAWEWMVLLCIQNKNGDTVMPLPEFLRKYGKNS